LKQSSPVDATCHDFLAVDHEELGFLINRDQFFASVYLETVDPFPESQAPPEFYAGTMVFRQDTLLVYTLDDKLGNLFGTCPQKGLKIALITDTTTFSEEHRRRFLDMVEKAAPDASREMIAFRIGSQAEIKGVPLHHIRLIPGALRMFLRKKGVLGCRFSETGNMSFLVDIETITYESIGNDE